MGTTYGVLNVRNKSDQPCQVSGVPDVAYLDDAGNIVQSTAPTLLGQSQGVATIVLERDSWAAALIGLSPLPSPSPPDPNPVECFAAPRR